MALVCQRCQQPLRLDASLNPLGQSAFDMVASSLPDSHASQPSTPAVSPLSRLPTALQTAYAHRSSSPASRQVIAAPPGRQTTSLPSTSAPPPPPPPPPAAAPPVRTWHTSNPAESYVLLTESQIRPPATTATTTTSSAKGKQPDGSHESQRSLSADLARTHALFDLVSAHSDIDHPLCTECGTVLASLMDRQLSDAKKERERYLAYERSLSSNKSKSEAAAEVEALEAEITRLQAEEAQAIRELEEAEEERAHVDAELADLDRQSKELEAEEQAFWRDHCLYVVERNELMDQLQSVQTRFEHDKKELERLQKANVYNDAFHITFHDGVGCINGLRLGRTPKGQLDWPEFNAAMGYVVMLVSVIARRLGHEFRTFRLIPMASFSKVENTATKTAYNLYGSSDIALSYVFNTKRLNEGMVALLDCVKQVMDVATARDPSLRFPNAINKDTIGEKCIRQPQLAVYDDGEWCVALCKLLVNLKALLGRV